MQRTMYLKQACRNSSSMLRSNLGHLVQQFSIQLGNKCGLTVVAQLTRNLGQIHFVAELTQPRVSDPGHHGPLVATFAN